MKQKEIICGLENIGLSTYEAKAYLAALYGQPLTGYKLSKISGVPRSRIYETIEKLVSKNLILYQTGEKTLLRPVSMESFLEKKEKENIDTINFLRENIYNIKKSTRDQGIWNITDRNKIFETINQLIGKTSKHIYILGSSNDLCIFEEPLKNAEKRKVIIYGIYCGKKKLKIAHLLYHRGQTCSSCREIAMCFDSNYALVGFTYPEDNATAALTQNEGIIYIIEEYIKHEIFISRLFQDDNETILEKMRAIYKKEISRLP